MWNQGVFINMQMSSHGWLYIVQKLVLSNALQKALLSPNGVGTKETAKSGCRVGEKESFNELSCQKPPAALEVIVKVFFPLHSRSHFVLFSLAAVCLSFPCQQWNAIQPVNTWAQTDWWITDAHAHKKYGEIIPSKSQNWGKQAAVWMSVFVTQKSWFILYSVIFPICWLQLFEANVNVKMSCLKTEPTLSAPSLLHPVSCR